MSAAQHPSVGGTLTAGIQDVSAILPIIGTNQCENHVGSALEGGYLYAAAAPLSIFGSLGIVKAGVAVLISSISIPAVPGFLRRRYQSLPQGRWLGARVLGNAGFRLQGSVAPLIGMDDLTKKRFKAEERLLEILEEKHIDDPESISIEWRSRRWNIMLVFCTQLAAFMSLAPYITLLLGPTSWRPERHLPWVFPLLRTAGSCLAAVCCQFLIQSRVIYLMKSRVLFMTIHRRLVDNALKDKKAELDFWLQKRLDWNAALPSEQCIWRLEQFLSSGGSLTWQKDDANEKPDHISIEMETSTAINSIYSIPSWIWSSEGPPKFPSYLFRKNFAFDCNTLQRLRSKHFANPGAALDRNMALILWIILFLSIPATIAGYVGCFTLVSASPRNGPLIWLGLEAALSIIRILIWAWNPSFDENTGVDIKLKLSDRQPMVTTEDYNPYICDLDSKERKPIVLVPERQFLEWITPYTGPLEQSRFRDSENLAVYFTLTVDYTNSYGTKFQSLFLTVLDVNKRTAVTLSHVKGVYTFFAATAPYNPISGGMEVNLHNVMHDNDIHRTNDPVLFEALLGYHKYLLIALNQASTPHCTGKYSHVSPRMLGLGAKTATLGRKWDLFPFTMDMHLNEQKGVDQTQPTLMVHNMLYLDRGYEHHLKSQLVDLWGGWIVTNMDVIYRDARCDCYDVIADKSSEKAKETLNELDQLIAWEQTQRELAYLELSTKLEDVLRGRMERCINAVGKKGECVRLREWMRREFEIGRLKRMDKERRDTKERIEEGMKGVRDRAEREGRDNQEYYWQIGLKFIEDQWSAGITGGHTAIQDAESELDELINYNLGGVNVEFTHWAPQWESEQCMMEAAVAAVNGIHWEPNVSMDSDGQRKKMDRAYEYPEADYQATQRFVNLKFSSSKGKACAAIVYDAYDCDEETVCDIIRQDSGATRSVINVRPGIVASIPENNHLLFLSYEGGGGGLEPAFIQRNRDRWWGQAEQENINSSTFYFSPPGLNNFACYSQSGTIAHIFIFLAFPSRVRLRLLHYSSNLMSVSIREGGNRLAQISRTDIPKDFRLQDLRLAELRLGRHELEIEVVVDSGGDLIGHYFLRNILIDFPENTGPDSPVATVTDVDSPIHIAIEGGSAYAGLISSQIEEVSEVAPDIQTSENPEELNDDP